MDHDQIRFYLDENLPPEIAAQLATHGIDVIRGPLRDSDINHLRRASAMGRVLCTRDKHFVELHGSMEEHAGIVKGLKRHSVGDWVKFLKFVHTACSVEEMKNSIEFLFAVD